jgi:hypothetical protein
VKILKVRHVVNGSTKVDTYLVPDGTEASVTVSEIQGIDVVNVNFLADDAERAIAWDRKGREVEWVLYTPNTRTATLTRERPQEQ